MDFTFTDEQQQFADALRRYLDKNYGFEARQAIVYSDAGVSDYALGGVRRTRVDRIAGAGRAGRLQRHARSICWW